MSKGLKKILISRKTIYQIFISLLVLILFMTDRSLLVTQIILCAVFFECFFISFTDRFFNVYQIFLFMLFMFNLSIPIFNLFGLYEYPNGYMFMYNQGIRTAIEEQTLIKTYEVLTILLLGSSIGWLLSREKTHNNDNCVINEQTGYYLGNDVVYKWLFYILMPIEFVYELILVRYSLVAGYVSTMHLHSYAGPFSTIFSSVDYLYTFIGFSTLYTCRDEKKYLKYATMFILPLAVQMFTGLRGNFVCVFLAVLFVYSWNFKQISVRMACFLLGTGFFIITALGVFRFTHSTSDLFGDIKNGLLGYIINEICANGESIVVVSYTIQLRDHFFNSIPFLLGYIAAIFSFSSNYTYEGLLDKSYLAQHITYLLNPNRFLGGSTIGTAIAAEFYEFANGNYIIILILSILLLYFANVFIKNMYKNQLWFYFALSYLQNLFLSPRGSVMKIFSKLSLTYCAIYLILDFLLRKRGNKNV